MYSVRPSAPQHSESGFVPVVQEDGVGVGATLATETVKEAGAGLVYGQTSPPEAKEKSPSAPSGPHWQYPLLL